MKVKMQTLTLLFLLLTAIFHVQNSGLAIAASHIDFSRNPGRSNYDHLNHYFSDYDDLIGPDKKLKYFKSNRKFYYFYLINNFSIHNLPHFDVSNACHLRKKYKQIKTDRLNEKNKYKFSDYIEHNECMIEEFEAKRRIVELMNIFINSSSTSSVIGQHLILNCSRQIPSDSDSSFYYQPGIFSGSNTAPDTRTGQGSYIELKQCLKAATGLQPPCDYQTRPIANDDDYPHCGYFYRLEYDFYHPSDHES